MNCKYRFLRFILIIISVVIFVSSCESDEVEEISNNDRKVDEVYIKDEEKVQDNDFAQENKDSNIKNRENKENKFKFSSEYRYKNSYERISIDFNEIELINEYKGVFPEREAFLIFHIKYNAPFISKYTLINLPSIITGPNVSYTSIIGNDVSKEFNEYKSLNNFISPSVDKDDGLKYDLVTLINYDLGYIELPEANKNGYVSAYNTDFVSIDGKNDDLERALIFDINKKDALNPENYLVYDPHGRPGEEIDHPEEKIYFSKFINDKTK